MRGPTARSDTRQHFTPRRPFTPRPSFKNPRGPRATRLQKFLSPPPCSPSAPSPPSRSCLVRAHPLPNPTRKATRHTAHPRTHRTTRPPRRRQNQPTGIKSLLPPRHPHSLNQRLPTPMRLKLTLNPRPPRSRRRATRTQSEAARTRSEAAQAPARLTTPRPPQARRQKTVIPSSWSYNNLPRPRSPPTTQPPPKRKGDARKTFREGRPGLRLLRRTEVFPRRRPEVNHPRVAHRPFRKDEGCKVKDEVRTDRET